MLKKTVTSARCRVEFDLYLEGSLLADTNQGGVTQLRTHLVLESPEPEEVVCRIIRAAKRGCYAEQLVQNPVPLVSSFELNGSPLEVPLR